MPSGKAHIIVGTIASGVALYNMGGPISYSLIGGVAALLPDVDTRTSMLGRFTPLHYIMKHRGFTHSYLAFSVLFYSLLLTQDWGLVVAASAGYLSHIWLDWLIGARGVTLWWPKKKRSSFIRLWKGGAR